MTVVAWNEEAQRLTGVSAEDAIGRPCWETLRGLDEDGSLFCHRGCSIARLAREGWPVAAKRLVVRGRKGPRPVVVSTVAARNGGDPVFLHLLQKPPRRDGADEERASAKLTSRQLDVLELLSQGIRARAIADRLSITENTTRNHIHNILRELDAHSQLEALVRARRLGLIA